MEIENVCAELACKTCGKQFTRLVGYNRHTAVCGNRAKDDTFEWNSDRIASNETCKENKHSAILENNFIEITHEPFFECAKCLRKFLCEKSLIKHQTTIHQTMSSKPKPVKNSEIMRCEACSKKFKAKNAFLRHKNRCKTSFECTICKKIFIGRRNLVRHENTIHEISQNSHCLMCTKKFNRKDNFRRHLESCKNRLVLDFYTCAYCGCEFDKKNVLKWHIFRKHWNVNVIKCEICQAQFKGPSSEIILQRHVREYHIENNSTGSLKCALCVKAFSSRDNILNHIIVEHDITIDHEHLKFSSVDEFKAWKITMEKASTTFFRNRRGSTHSKKYAVSIYECHRSGFYQPKTDDRKRRIKLQGTKKMGSYCPAEITLCVRKSDDSCRVSYISMHLGHNVYDENELAHLSVPKDERVEIATKISMGVSYEKILKEHVQSEKDRLYFLSRKDLNNISRAFNVKEKPSVLSHQNSELVNVESFMKQHEESILFFKQIGEISDPDDNILSAQDFFLVVMTEKQKETLRKFGSKVVSVDGTFALENCNFLFLTLLVVDDYHEAIPVAFALSNRNKFTLVDMFLNCVLKEMGALETEIFMSDVERNYHDRWEKIMSPAQNRPFCKWHVPETWRRKLKKIANMEKRSVIRKRLHEITTLLDENLFYSRLDEYLANADPDFTEFLEELKTLHYNEIENWAHYFRENSKSNTNIHAESFNRTLKYFYGKLVKTKTLSEILTLIDDYLNFKEFELKRKEIRGVLSHKLSDLRRRHDDCMKKGIMITIEDAHCSGWCVSVTDESSEIADVHFIRECDDICSGCKLYCEKCDTCAQKYQCTCADSVVKNNMCMHIHALSMYLKDESDMETKSSVSSVNHVQSTTNLFDMSDSEKFIEIMNYHCSP